MKLKLIFRYLILASLAITSGMLTANAQSTDPKFNVMMQGFWWNSYQDATVASEGGLYSFLKTRAGQLQATGIDVIWTPPPSQGDGMAYFPQQLFSYNNAHGSESQLRAMLTEFKAKGMHGMADIIANHRNGTTAWADFTNPTWGCEVIVDNDEVKGVAGQVQPCSGQVDEGEGFAGVRDMNHKSLTVQNGYKTYLANLKGLGFDSWRWDFTKGFPAKYVAEYNASSTPYFSVGEYFDANISLLTNWVTASGNTLTGTTAKSATFDFSTFYILDRAVKGSWSELNSSGHMPGLAGTFGYANYAVTFAENHDAHNIAGNDNIMKANAYILTHPGIPMVFMPHWLNNKQKINELIAVRKQNGINAFSSITIDASSTFYAAYIDSKVAVKIGSGTWSPAGSGWILNTSGTDYAVWSKINITTPTVIPEPYNSISMIGPAVGGWTIDVPMTTTDGITYKIYNQSFSKDSVKFRAGNSWTSNWGGTTFPNGTAISFGDNIAVTTAAKYNVTFNLQTLAYSFGAPTNPPPNNFQKLFVTGAATSNQSIALTTTDGFNYTLLNYAFSAGGLKIRDSAGTSLWGSAAWPSGNAVLNGASIPVVVGIYSVKYNKVTGYYEFQSADTSVSLIGTGVGGWTIDVVMKSTDLGNNFSVDYTLLTGEVKFRKNKAWTTNWGGPKTDSSGTGFSGIGTQDGKNIGVPAGSYRISFKPSNGAFSFKVITPVITSFTPTSSSTGGNITIKGANFNGASIVKFGTVNASSFTVLNDSVITGVVGSGATGKVTVTTPVGTATSVANFTYVALPTITSFTPTNAASGATVTITGTNFTGATVVKFGGTNATSFSVVSSTTITAVVGSGASGSVTVTTPVSTASLAGFIFGCIQPGLSSVTAGNTLLCFGKTTTLTANDVVGTSASVNWFTGTNGTGTALGAGVTLPNVGAGTYFARVTNSCGTPAESSITIVGDTVKPTITCPANKIVYNNSGCSTSVTIPNPLYADNCAVKSLTWKALGATVLSSPTTLINTVGTKTFNYGTTTITYSVKDSSNLLSTCVFTVKVIDSIKPTFTTIVSSFSDTIALGCFKMIKFPALTFTDNCGTPTLKWAMTGANKLTGTGSLDSANMKAGLTTVKYTLTDLGLASSTASQNVNVIEKVSPVITCPATITKNVAACSASVVTPAPVYSDNCNIKSLTWSMTGATVLASPTTKINLVGTKTFNVGTTVVKYTVKDSSNNPKFCTFNVIVTSSITCFAAKGIVQNEVETLGLSATLSPNPTTTSFGLLVKSDVKEIATVIVYNGDGQKISQLQVTPNRMTFIGDRFKNGTYLFQVIQREKRTTVKGMKL